MTNIDAVLEVENLRANIGTSQILHGVSFTARRQRVTTILGRNGVGKTTTMRAIVGLVDRDGSVTHNGERIDRTETHRIIGRGIAYVPEDREVFSGLTVAENLQLAERRGIKPRYDLVHDLFPELKQRAAQAAGTLSGGQQQMLALGRALLNENNLLLIDEPTKGLAPRVVTEVVHVLERAREVATIVMVEQNLAAARRLSDDVVVLSQGQVVMSGPADEVFADGDRVREQLGVTAGGAA